MEERRRIDRVGYQAKSVIVVCDSGESIFVETCNVSPLGIAFTMPAGSPDLKGKDIIIVADMRMSPGRKHWKTEASK